MGYRITSDSTTDLPKSFYEEHGIELVRLKYYMNDKEYNDGDEAISPKEFYQYLRDGGSTTTSQVNAFQFTQFATPFLKAGEDILHIAFSSALSGTYASCEAAAVELREQYPERQIVVIDSLSASMGEGLLLYYADKNRAAGMSFADNVQWIIENRLKLCHWFTVGDLMYLHRGGRVSRSSAILGSLLGIKPVLHMDNEGRLMLVKKVRGRGASLESLVDRMIDTATVDLREQQIFISHGDCEEDAKKLAAIITEKTGAANIQFHTVGTVIGSHSGPGTIALFFLGSER